MDKIKVSKCLAEDLDFVKKHIPFETIMDLHINKKWRFNYTKQFKELELEKLCKLLINGYEIEETPEDKLLNHLKIAEADSESAYNRGFSFGVRQTLTFLNIKIKGIND